MNIDNTYDVGIYLRLSKDDNNGHLESMSISNQRQLLKDYVLEKGWKLVEEYVDDGWTGTNFERPSFKRMIDDALNGKINCIITKDLSRLGRNYVQAGYYTDEFFPENDITRAEFIKILVTAVGISEAEYNNEFTDVASDAWYAGYVKAALENNIASGFDGKFNPDANITREEMAKIKEGNT